MLHLIIMCTPYCQNIQHRDVKRNNLQISTNPIFLLLVDLVNIQKTGHLLYSVPFCSVLKHGLANTHPHPKHQNTTPDPPHPTTTLHLILNVLLHHLHHNPHHLPLLLTPFLPICRTTLPTPTKTGARSSMIPGGYKAS